MSRVNDARLSMKQRNEGSERTWYDLRSQPLIPDPTVDPWLVGDKTVRLEWLWCVNLNETEVMDCEGSTLLFHLN